jgi:hypothetical protein
MVQVMVAGLLTSSSDAISILDISCVSWNNTMFGEEAESKMHCEVFSTR